MAGTRGNTQVGRVSVRVIPDTSRFREELKALLKRRTSGLEVKIPAKVDKETLTKSIASATKDLDPIDIKMRADKDSFAKDLRTDLTKGRFSGELKVPTVPDTSQFVSRVRREVGTLPPISMRVDLDDDAVAKLHKKVETAQEALARARDQHTNSVQRLAMAEARLTELRKSSTTYGVRLAQAEINLDQARRQVTARADEVVRANDRLSVSYRNLENYTPRIEKSSNRISQALKNVRGSANRTGQTFLGLGRVGWIVMGVFTLAPPVLGAVAGLLAGIPPLLAAIGAGAAAIALGWDGIKNAFGDLDDEVKALQKSVSATFERTLAPAIDDLERTLPKLEAGLNAVAKGASNAFAGFTDAVSSSEGVAQLNRILNGTGELLNDLRPTIRKFTESFLQMGAIGADNFDMLSNMLNRWSDDFSAMVDRMAANGVLEGALSGLTRIVESLLGLLNKLFEEGARIVKQIGPEMAEFIDAFGDAVISALPGLTDLAEELLPVLSDALRALGPIISDVAKFLAEIVGWFNDLPSPVKKAAVALAAAALAIGKVVGAIKKLQGLGKVIGGITAALTGLGKSGKKAGKAGAAAGTAFVLGAGSKMDKGAPKAGSKFMKGLKKIPVIGTGVWIATEITDAFGITVTDKLTGQQMGISDAMGLGFERGGEAIKGVAADAANEVAKIGKAAANGGKLAVEGLAQIDPELMRLTEHFRKIGEPEPFMAASQHMELMRQNVMSTASAFFGAGTQINTVGAGIATSWESSQDRVSAKTWDVWPSLSGIMVGGALQAQGQIASVGGGIAATWGGAQDQARNRTVAPWSMITNTIRNQSNSALGTVRSVGAGVSSSWGTNQDRAKNRSLASWSGISSFINSKANGIRGTVSRVGAGVANSWGSGQDRARNRSSNAWTAILDVVHQKSQAARERAKTGADGIKSAFNFSLSAQGSAIMSSLLSGLSSMLPNVIGFAAGIAGQIAAVKGPLSYDRKLLIPAGKAIMEGLHKGLKNNFGSIISLVSRMAPQIAQGLEGSSVGNMWAEDVKRGFPDHVTTGSLSSWQGNVDNARLGSAEQRVTEGVIEALRSMKVEISSGDLTRVTESEKLRNSRR